MLVGTFRIWRCVLKLRGNLLYLLSCLTTLNFFWRGARVVESGGLENRYRSNPIEGSNPSLSAQQMGEC